MQSLFDTFIAQVNKYAKRTDIKSVLIIGAGPIIIGQACEFDYSGVQACKALEKRVTKSSWSIPIQQHYDRSWLADATYIEPITWQSLEKIIRSKNPMRFYRPWGSNRTERSSGSQ